MTNAAATAHPAAETALAAVNASASSTGHEVSIGVTLFFAGLLVSMILCLAFEEKLHAKKSVNTSRARDGPCGGVRYAALQGVSRWHFTWTMGVKVDVAG